MRRWLAMLVRGGAALLALGGAGVPGFAAAGQQRYVIDQRFGDIEFTVEHLGVFSSQGEFRRFSGTLSVDLANPPDSGIDVDVDANSMTMASDAALTMLRSPEYFDVRKYGHIVFHSTAVLPAGANHYTIRGVLQIRGVAQPQTLDATLVDRHANPAGIDDIAKFVVTGTLKRSAFGMTADPVLVSDTVGIRILARIELAEAARTN